MKILYLLYFDIDSSNMIGVKKKITSQVKALDSLGHDTEIATRKGESLFFLNSKVSYPLKKGMTRYKNSIHKVLKENEMGNQYDLLYVRFPNTIDLSVIKLFKYFGKEKVVMEIPTYPIKGEYENELINLRRNKKWKEFILKKFVFFVHKNLIHIVRHYVSCIVTFMNFEKIWGIRTIVIDNGVDTSKFPVIRKKNTRNSEELVLLGVANVSYWHGFDRIIKGLEEYYMRHSSEKKVIFNIVGSGSEIAKLKEMVIQNNLKNYVFFMGPKYGSDLLEQYEKTDLAVSSLGLHRIGLLSGSTIKTKEYCSLGIPFLYSYCEKEIKEDFKYAKRLPPNDTPISIESIIDFFSSINNDEYPETMHSFAEDHYDWEIQMKKVVEIIQVGNAL